MNPKPLPSLYGITKSNRNRDELWGKNQFNSTFPTALCCYMRDKKIPAIYLKFAQNNNQNCVQSETLGFDEVFNTSLENKELSFLFESKFEPYQQWAYGDIGNIDLVIKHENKFLRALEIKLTVLPGDATHQDEQSKWGSELVVRAATTSYAALGIADSCHDILSELRLLFEPVCQPIRNWGKPTEIKSRKNSILDRFDTFQAKYCSRQKLYLMHPIWKIVSA